MEIIEITGFRTGLDESGVNFLDPKDAFDTMQNAFIYRQVLQSRKGFVRFANRLDDETRVMGIFENILPSQERELLVISKEFLYRYNTTTDEFDQIPFNARILALDPSFNFGIVGNEEYVSGTTYLTKTGAQRFVFTGMGMQVAPLTGGQDNSAVYFYDGTSVGDFFCALDNPDTQEPAASIGDVVRAVAVLFFGERLNLFVPTCVPSSGQVTYNQGVLFSGIRDSGGNGDKFNVPGSGLIQFDTPDLMKMAKILGDVIIAEFENSNWALEKTRDAFNPYFPRKIPSVLGIDAPFSAVQWNYEIKGLGKTGATTTDGRQALRFDNKIPFFTQDTIDAEQFDLTYGGFDRINGQFLWAYRNTLSNLADITQNETLVYNYEEKTWSIYDWRFSCFGQTIQGISLAWDDIDEANNPAWARWDETEEVWNKIGQTTAEYKTLAGDNYGFVYEINQDFDDYFVNISAITQAPNAIVTIDPSAFQIGDRVRFSNVSGMTQINELIGTVLAATDTTITMDINTTNFSAYVSGGSVSKTIAFQIKTIPINPWREAGRMIIVSHVEFLLATHGEGFFVDIFMDEEDTPFKTAFVASPSNTTKKRVWVEVEVNQEADFISLVLRNESVGNQMKLTSIRIHCEAGLETNP